MTTQTRTQLIIEASNRHIGSCLLVAGWCNEKKIYVFILLQKGTFFFQVWHMLQILSSQPPQPPQPPALLLFCLHRYRQKVVLQLHLSEIWRQILLSWKTSLLQAASSKKNHRFRRRPPTVVEKLPNSPFQVFHSFVMVFRLRTVSCSLKDTPILTIVLLIGSNYQFW